MEESKTLVDQLREMVELSIKSKQYPALHADSILGHLCVSMSDDRELFTTIADRIEREYMPMPLDADGVPIHVWDMVYFVDSAEAFDVLEVESDGDETVHIGRKDGTSTDAWVSPGNLTHKQPDSLERIEGDVQKTLEEYWECVSVPCGNCPAAVDGKRPWERYATIGSCERAQMLDLLRRQRELLERGQE